MNPCATNHNRYGESNHANGPDTRFAGLPIAHLLNRSPDNDEKLDRHPSDYPKTATITTAHFAARNRLAGCAARIIVYWRQRTLWATAHNVLIAGHKRYAALAQLGHSEIRAEVRPDGDDEASERAAENVVSCRRRHDVINADRIGMPTKP